MYHINLNVSDLEPCSHKEADTRMLVYAIYCLQGHWRVVLQTVNTDVVVLATALFHEMNLEQMEIAFRVGKHFQHKSIHDNFSVGA